MSDLDPTTRLIVQEAERRGIAVQLLAPRGEYFRLQREGRSILCRESLSELTSAVALSLCDDKRATHRLLRAAGLRLPEQAEAADAAANLAFLRRHRALVVKPARGEQGKGVSVGIDTPEALAHAVEHAARVSSVVVLEELVPGADLRVLVMGGAVVAAAVRRPPQVVGDGVRSLKALIEARSAERARETYGEARIPLDIETQRCVRAAGYELESVLPLGESVMVRKTANVHTGGTIHDVTAALHPALASAACAAAAALALPVAGIDLMVRDVGSPEYAILEVNERPGLANHEPQPTAARFLDVLFPETARP